MSTPGLGHTAARGAAVTIGGQLARMALQFVAVVVLARLLEPADFGIVALALLVVGFGELFRDFGLSQASVQATTLSIAQRSNLFWVNTGIGVLLAVLCVIASWPLAAISGQPEVAAVCQALAATFLLNAFAAQYRASLLRALRFSAIAMLEVGAALFGLIVAVIGGLVGLGYWSLVLQQLTTTTITLAGLVALARWIPRLPSREGDIRGFLKFGWNLVASQLVTYVGANVDTAIIGIRYSPTVLGLYNRAFQLVVVPVGQIRSPLTNVAVPVLSRLKDTVDEFNRFVQRAQLLLGYALCVPLALLAVAADPVVEIVLGADWAEASFFLRCFAVASMFQTLAFVGFWVYVARGLPHILFRYSIVSTVIKVVCVVTGSFMGPEGVAVGFAVAPALSWPLSLWWLSRHTTIPTRGLYAGAGRILAVAAMGAWPAAIVTLTLGGSLPAGLHIAASTLAFACGAATLLIFAVYRRDLHDIAQTARLMRRR